MAMSCDELKQLYERVVRQNPYPGSVCLAEHVLVKYESDELPTGLKDMVEEHFARCPECREEFIDLGRAGQWFRDHERAILDGLAYKASAAGILPWSRCPSVGILYRYVAKEIPDTPAGRILMAEADHHIHACPHCSRLVQEFRQARQAPVLRLRDLAADAGLAILDKVRGFFDALLAMTQVAGTPAYVRAAPGYRSGETARLDAPVVAGDGTLVVADDGKPRVCSFDVVQADVQEDGFLTVGLCTADKAYFGDPEHRYEAGLSITAGGVCIVLPNAPIDEAGQATFTGMLPEAVAVKPLPLPLLDVTVRPAS